MTNKSYNILKYKVKDYYRKFHLINLPLNAF